MFCYIWLVSSPFQALLNQRRRTIRLILNNLMTRFPLLVVAAVVLLLGCKQPANPNGTFLVYKVDFDRNGENKYSDALKQSFATLKFDIQFTDKYATLRPLSKPNSLVLAKSRVQGDTTVYLGSMKKDEADPDFNWTLKTTHSDTTLAISAYTAEWPHIGGGITCSLSKTDR